MYVSNSATEEFWDSLWDGHASETFKHPPKHRLTVALTKRFLKKGSRILEGGCGLGDKVLALHKAGFDSVGIDFAPRVVAAINENWPHLDVRCGDVRSIDFPDSTFDGYWSLGVIEHFWEGYSKISAEVQRVLKPGGYLFITFPMINSIRKKDISLGKYEELKCANSDAVQNNFYQFGLDPAEVSKHFQSLGFTLCYQSGLSSLDCLSEERPWFKLFSAPLKKLPFGFYTKIGVLLDLVFGKNFGHVAFLVLKKKL